MANITQMRGLIVDAAVPLPPSEDESSVCGPASDETWVGDDDGMFDDEDMWQAVDLMETSVKLLRRLSNLKGIHPRNRRIINNHCDDIAEFLGHMPDPPDDEEVAVAS